MSEPELTAEVVSVAGAGGQFNHALLGRLIAPEISNFTSAIVPDLSEFFPESEHWIANYFLNSVFTGNFPGKWRVYAQNLIYRAHNCLFEYERARLLTEEFLAKTTPGKPATGAYFRMLSTWETSLLNFSIAADIFRHMNEGTGVFSSKDGSHYQRAYDLANEVKHYGLTISNYPDFFDTDDLLPQDDKAPHAIPLWLNNFGFRSSLYELGFEEYGKAVRNVCEVADKLRNPSEFLEEAKKQRDAEAKEMAVR
jgi:hypothetical protein